MSSDAIMDVLQEKVREAYASQSAAYDAELSEALEEWLRRLCDLSPVPFNYLLPCRPNDKTGGPAGSPSQTYDEVLPPESIRFFFVDRGWIHALLNGALSVIEMSGTNLNVLNQMLAAVKASVAGCFPKDLNEPMTGFLLRSKIVRHVPNMVVRAYRDEARNQSLDVLRSEPLAGDVRIALFRGRAAGVEIQEPEVGTAFGVEAPEPGKAPAVKLTGYNGEFKRQAPDKPDAPMKLSLPFKGASDKRVIDVQALYSSIAANVTGEPSDGDSTLVALSLQQRAYCHVFQGK